jgi:hypothetical protein
MSDAIDRAAAALGARVHQRQLEVESALARHCPEFPLALLRQAFGARLESVRTPDIDYGPDPPAAVPLSEPWVRPKPPKGDYPVVVAQMSPEKRRFLRRKRLPRVRRAGMMRDYGHHE